MSFHHRSSLNRFNPPAVATRYPPRCPPFRPIVNTSRSVVTNPRPPSPIKPAIKCNLPAAKSVATTRYHGDVHKNMPRIVYKPEPDSDGENDVGGETASSTKRSSESELTAYAPLQKKSCPSVPIPMPKFNSIEDIRKAFSEKSLQPIQLGSIYPETFDEDANGVSSDAEPVDKYVDEAYCNPKYARRMVYDSTSDYSLDYDAWKSYRVQSKQVSSGSDLDSNWNEEDIRNTSSPGFDETTNSKCEQFVDNFM